MSEAPEGRLDDLDLRVVREAMGDLEDASPPAAGGATGCLAGLLGLGVLLAWPRLQDRVPGGDFVSPFVYLLGALLLVGGPILAFFGGGARKRGAAAVEAALRRLEDPEADRETLLRATTLLVVHARLLGEGPAERAAELDEVSERVGERRPLVEAVERYLVERHGLDPVFTLADRDG